MSHIRQVKDLELRMKEMEDDKKQLLKKSRASAEEMRKEIEGLEENITHLKGELQDKDRQYRGVVKDLHETKSEVCSFVPAYLPAHSVCSYMPTMYVFTLGNYGACLYCVYVYTCICSCTCTT